MRTIGNPGPLRVVAGLVIAPAAPALLLYVLLRISAESAPYLLPTVMLTVAYPLTLVLAAPAYLLSRKTHANGMASALFIGATIGLLGYAMFVVLTTSAPVYGDELRRTFLASSFGLGVACATWGAISGLVFWIITSRVSK